VHVTSADERRLLLSEMRLIATRLGVEAADSVPLDAFLEADGDTHVGKARRQYCAHVAYYAATRPTLVRIWEDLGLLQSMLHDGGFNQQMTRFDGVVSYVVDFSFQRARDRYRSLFDQANGYTWYVPSADAYADAIYELANTYLGSIRSDVLGQVYERTPERIDRKLLGQYYTPRDIIALIWDLIGLGPVAEAAEAAGRQLRVLDIATGSGGFLVEAAGRLRDRLAAAQAAGAEISTQQWLDQAALGLNGIEIQRFSAYVAELNLLVQMGQVVAADPSLRVPPLGVLCADTLSLHEPDTLVEANEVHLPNDLLIDNEERRELGLRIKAAVANDFLFDVMGDSHIPAAYLAALYNSTIYQEAAEGLPPGQLRQQDLERLGLPNLADRSGAVDTALRLAGIVTDLIRIHGPRWPLLPDELRNDITLADPPDSAWTPPPGPSATWGRLPAINWVADIARHRSGSTRLGEVTVDHDLFGLTVKVATRGDERPAVTVELAEGDPVRTGDREALAVALADRLRGVAAVGGCVRDLDEVRLPTAASVMTELHGEHRQALITLVAAYKAERAAIDAALDLALSAAGGT